MTHQPNPSISPWEKANDDREFEWLLCVASTFQACPYRLPHESKEIDRLSGPHHTDAAIMAWTHVDPGILIRGAVSSWLRRRSKHRHAA
jgi:hypothetical protein